jgi:deoxyribodipyrimidine photo-lyase
VLGGMPVRGEGDFVLYWMVAHRRLGWNFALDQAVAHARNLDLPLVILEALAIDYPWASRRHHRFALDGMREHRDRLAGEPVRYHAYVEPEPGAGRGLLEALARRAAVVVTDDYPTFFLPRLLEAAARRVSARLEAVDGNGLYPMRAAGRAFGAAVHFRRHLQKALPDHLVTFPAEDPFEGPPLPESPDLGATLEARWPAATDALLDGESGALEALPLDGGVEPVAAAGGTGAARERLVRFLDGGLDRYAELRNDPDADASSRLSPWLHWGHLSVHEIFHRLACREGWSPARLSPEVNAKRHGWWGMSPGAEAYLDELVTWRELGFGFCAHRQDHADYGSLPDWARDTLETHAGDRRPYVYDLDTFERAQTHDELWNAAQRELRGRGTIHNYLRMLWGKKILEWTDHPRTALDVMVTLNDRWALDGRDPNSWSGIFWVLGRFDRAWPERPVYGKVRSMSSDSTRRKVSVDDYLRRWGPGSVTS